MQPIKLHPTVNFQVKAIQYHYGLCDKESFINELSNVSRLNNNFLWDNIGFHRIRPLISHAVKQSDTQATFPELTRRMLKFSLQQAIRNLLTVREFNNLAMLFAKNNIPILPYKGLLLQEKVYTIPNIRECGDLDILVSPLQAIEGMKLLLQNGYQFKVIDEKILSKIPAHQVLEEVFKNGSSPEMNFIKEVIYIDFHWNLTQKIFPYKLEISDLISNAELKDFLKTNTLVPNPSDIFYSMILHHAGKEFWVKFKHIVDLIQFLDKFGSEVEWTEIFNKLYQYNLYTPTVLGFQIVELIFGYPLPDSIRKHLPREPLSSIPYVVRYWHETSEWNSLRRRIKFEKIVIRSQDKIFSKRNYLMNYYRNYSIPNPLEQPRIINFPPNYYFLNFISKIISYSINKF